MGPRTALRERLLQAALGYPEAWEDYPWGEQVVKVRKRIFALLGEPGAPEPRIALKLPVSHELARSFRAAEPAGYGLGRAGWVNVHLSLREGPPIGVLLDWLDESYRAIAPKRLVGLLDGQRGSGPP